MQKVIAVAINVNQLVSQSEDTFAIAEPEGLNALLAQGWEIEDWTFLTDDPINGKIPMMVVLTDNLLPEEEALYGEWHDEEEPDDAEEDEADEVRDLEEE